MLSFSFIALLALLAVLVTWTKNVFMSLMYSVMLFINATVVLLLLGFEFLALINVLIYVGALAVLFLFVIMLLEVPATELRAYYRGYSTLALIGVLSPFISGMTRFLSGTNPFADSVFTGGTSSGISNFNFQAPVFNPTMESISAIGHAFYIRYADVLILNSLVLTIALFGALVLVNAGSSGLQR
jgi:NADH:ubiquinone oxidoreductase subunit 6 (subunit J)|uniref:NADH-ubiquinone oxidoreductase chain 6 n=1 Tax=Chlorosarcinopsis eremi TaxID=332213 RepID=A0A411PNZ2_9CHLO|nr:NADH dehydrogenase subunit 6 [Chlorosarcinopsis eremi]QBG38061.1 NADH dehydrogenase subunit 6 [Chlorosarcinopsis eremi]